MLDEKNEEVNVNENTEEVEKNEEVKENRPVRSFYDLMMTPFNMMDEFLSSDPFEYYTREYVRPSYLTLKTDVRDTENGYVFDIDLPGVNKDNIHISTKNGYLNVEVKVEKNSDDSNDRYIRQERYSGTSSRSYYIGNVDKSAMKASFKNGVLSIVVPKQQQPEDTYLNID